MKRLDNWSLIRYDHGNGPRQCLHGNVSGHPEFPDGVSITTTPVAKAIGHERFAVRTESGSWYLLGTIDPEYDKRYPSAGKRLVASYQAQERALALFLSIPGASDA